MSLPHGLFGWVDVALPDPEAGAAFYGGLFGWEPTEAPWYTIFELGGTPVAGMAALGAEAVEAGQQPVWSSYVMVDDADAIAARAMELGATVLLEPIEVPEAGRMCFVVDPVGAAIGFWAAGDRGGAEVFNVPGTLTWNELACRDVNLAIEFYTKLLGWRATTEDADGLAYTLLTLGERSNAGMYAMSDQVPDAVPAHWKVWFSVADVDTAARRTEELGGTVRRTPQDVGPGRVAGLTDPQGAAFEIYAGPVDPPLDKSP